MDRQIIDYLPPVMQDKEEIIQICNAEQKAKEKIWQDIDNVFAERNVSSQSEMGAMRWEKTLGIIPKDTESLEIRNFRIMGRLQEDLPYTDRTLEKQIEALCGIGNFTLDIKSDIYTVKICVALKSRELKDAVDALADRVVPAHLILIVELMYNTYRMIANTGLTHAQLTAYTHAQLKEAHFEN